MDYGIYYDMDSKRNRKAGTYNMSLKNVLIIVDNIDESIDFYEELFGLRVITRLEGNVIMSEGLVLQDVDVWYDSRAAGSELLAECRTLHGCETGEAKITKAYNLPCDYVIHTVGPIWNGGRNREEELLANCYFNSMKLAMDNGIRSIAFPSISTGVYSFPVELAAKIAVHTVNRFLQDNPDCFDLVEWVLFDTHTESVYESEVDKIYNK